MSNIYKEGVNRKEQLLFPPSIDEYVSENNIVRVIDEYVELIDMIELGFTKANLKSLDGQPAYHPKLLLKIYIYGYLNKIRSSRALEKEIKRNIEMMWLCSGLSPSYKTISNFRKENYNALKRVFKEFVFLIKNIDLITGDVVAIDGAFLRANASKNRLIMKKSIQKELKSIDENINNYLNSMEFADKEDKRDKGINIKKDKLSKLKELKVKLNKDLAFLEKEGLTQYNKTDKDAKLMTKPAHSLMAYNVQIAVDKKYKFIAVTDVSLQGNDSNELYNMAIKTKELIDNKNMIVVADKGYFDANEIKKCLDDNIDIKLPISNTGQTQGIKGKFKKRDFIYNQQKDCYICPNNQCLTKRSYTKTKSNKIYFYYRANRKVCIECPIRDKCLSKTDSKTITRWESADIIDKFSNSMKTTESKNILKQRSSIVEHPFCKCGFPLVTEQ